MPRIAHIINPVVVDKSSDLFKAQPITFESMRIARNYAQQVGIDVDIIASFFPKDEKIVPDYFIKAKPLELSILDIDGVNEEKKLPFIADILERMYRSSNADYLIYTNVDIALMPSFYQSVANIIEQKYESFIINRRTIQNRFNVNQIGLMYSEIGQEHPGSDCFVFTRKMYEKFKLGKI